MYKIDLHTHSAASPDGGLSLADYERALSRGQLDVIAITDHNDIGFASQAQARLGESIIVGEEISTQQGDLIGLYLTEAVSAGLDIEQAIAAIRRQHGLVYVPHPFEMVRRGLSGRTLSSIADAVDVVEIFNGRTMFRNRSRQAAVWAAEHGKVGAASSDAHGRAGWLRTYSLIKSKPTRQTLVSLLASASYNRQSVGRGRLYPKLNRTIVGRLRGGGHA